MKEYQVGDKVIVKSQQEIDRIYKKEKATDGDYGCRTRRWRLYTFCGRKTEISDIREGISGNPYYILKCSTTAYFDGRHITPFVSVKKDSIKVEKIGENYKITDKEGDSIMLSPQDLNTLISFKDGEINGKLSIFIKDRKIWVKKDLDLISLYKIDLKEIKKQIKR